MDVAFLIVACIIVIICLPYALKQFLLHHPVIVIIAVLIIGFKVACMIYAIIDEKKYK